MKTVILVFLAAMLPFVSAAAQDPVSMVRTKVDTSAAIWTGQRVELVVDLVAPGYFSGSPVFDLPSLADVIVVPPTGSPVVGSEDIGEKSYIMQRHVVVLYPRRPGVFEIPSFTVRFAIKPDPLAHDAIPQTVKTTAIRLEAKQPPGLPADGMTVTSADLTLEESWKPAPGHDAKPGDAFVRTVKWRASDVTGIAFPPFPDAASGPLARYRAAPVVEDENSRGGTSGTRTDVLTYVCKAGGNADIPAFTFRWWDPVAKEIRQVVFPAREIHVIAPPVPPEPWSEQVWDFLRRHVAAITMSSAALVFLSVVGWFARESIAGFFRSLRPSHLPPLNPSESP